MMLSVKHLMAGMGHSLFNPGDLNDPLISPMDSDEDSLDANLPTDNSSKPEYGTFNSNFSSAAESGSAYQMNTTDIDGIVAAINPPELRVTASEISSGPSKPDETPSPGPDTDSEDEDRIVPVKEELEYERPNLNRFSSLFTTRYDDTDGFASSVEWKEDVGIQEEGKVVVTLF